MMKLFSRGLKRSFDHYVTLDIGSEFIKALTVEIGDNKVGSVLGVGVKKHTLGDMQSNAITDINNIIQNANEAILKANKMAGIQPEQILLGIAGELVIGKTISLTFKRPDQTEKLDQTELENIIHKVQWKAFEQLRAEIAYETGFNEIDIKLINAAIIDIAVDGYPVKNPIGFQGKEVELTLFNAFSPIVHYGAIQTIVAELNLELLAITAEPYALAKTLLEKPKEEKADAIIIDVGSSTTDIVLIKDNSLMGTKMFSLGGRIFTKRLAQSLNVSFVEAEEIKMAYGSEQLEKQSHKIVREAILDDAQIWLSGIKLSLSEFADNESLPSQILLCGGGSMLPEIKEALETREWSKKLPFPKKPIVGFLDEKDITNIKDKTKSLNSPQMITPLALANIGLELAREEKLLNKILKKVIRLMA